MARKKIIQTSNYPYHITARSNNHDYFGIDPDTLWNIFNDYLHFLSIAFRVKTHAFVMMSNHFHLMASFPESNMHAALNRFMTETSRVINHSRKTVNHTYGKRHHACLIDNDLYYACAYRYVFQNPVRAEICQMVEEYPYSSLSGLIGKRRLDSPVYEYPSSLVPQVDNLEHLLAFLNQPVALRTADATRKALHRTRFKFAGTYLAWTRTHGGSFFAAHHEK
ncbi:MAG: transposase [Deltaproteobacteria bacterium]|nr:transposase [Deltaproteobacteria bacterium]